MHADTMMRLLAIALCLSTASAYNSAPAGCVTSNTAVFTGSKDGNIFRTASLTSPEGASSPLLAAQPSKPRSQVVLMSDAEEVPSLPAFSLPH